MAYNILDLFYFRFYNGHYYVSDKRNIEKRKIFNEKYSPQIENVSKGVDIHEACKRRPQCVL